MPDECTHQYIFLRQEKIRQDDSAHDPRVYKKIDVFFCNHCLDYQRVHVQTIEEDRYRIGETVTWRKD